MEPMQISWCGEKKAGQNLSVEVLLYQEEEIVPKVRLGTGSCCFL